MIRILLLFCVLIAGFPDILAAQKTDTIVLVNQDKVVGELKGLVDGILTLKTEYMGTLKIEWYDIVSVWSDKLFAIQLHNLQIFKGTIYPGERNGVVVINDEERGGGNYNGSLCHLFGQD